MRARRAAVAALVLAALTCFPAGAGAKTGPDRPPRGRIHIELAGSNGYSIHISVNPRRHLILRTSKEVEATKEALSTEYLTRDTLADTDRVKAKLLGLGTISVRFHPRGRALHPSVPGCKGKRPAVQRGVVRGTIKFAGEGGYTQVKTREAKAYVEESTSWRCRYEGEPEPNPYPRSFEWDSKFSAGGEGAYFLARKYRPGVIAGDQVLYFVETGEVFVTASGRRLPLAIYRSLLVPAPASTFDDAHLEQLTVAPPPPFSGTAALSRTPESVFRWQGDLAVQFPGLDPIPLAGPGFEPGYCLREWGCIHQHFRHPPPPSGG